MNCYQFGYRGFDLHCAPILMEEGGFVARVAIDSRDGKRRMEQHFSSFPRFCTIEGAVAHAREWGMRWIDEGM